MRVISGVARGTKLISQEGLDTRPTLDRVKEALFSIIQFDLEGKSVLDLFAGSGALGIEALSRGAKKAVFCDKDIKAIKEAVCSRSKRYFYGTWRGKRRTNKKPSIKRTSRGKSNWKVFVFR